MSRLVAIAAFSGAVAVMAGAFGAHAVTGRAAELLKTGGQYELIHAVAAILALQLGMRVAAQLMLGGSVLFAATLYAMALGAPGWLGAITPIGGVGMIAGWICLGIGALRRRA